MRIGAIRAVVCEAVADGFAQAFQPASCPGKLDGEYRKSHRYSNQAGARSDDHDDAKQYYRAAHNSNGDALRRLVGEMYCLLYHVWSRLLFTILADRECLFYDNHIVVFVA